MGTKESSSSSESAGVVNLMRFMGLCRATIGIYFLRFPEDSTQRLLADPSRTKEAKTFGRLAAGRDLALGLGTLIVTVGEKDHLYPWAIAGTIADSIDVYTFLLDDSLTISSRVISGVVALGAVGLGTLALLRYTGTGHQSATGPEIEDD